MRRICGLVCDFGHVTLGKLEGWESDRRWGYRWCGRGISRVRLHACCSKACGNWRRATTDCVSKLRINASETNSPPRPPCPALWTEH